MVHRFPVRAPGLLVLFVALIGCQKNAPPAVEQPAPPPVAPAPTAPAPVPTAPMPEVPVVLPAGAVETVPPVAEDWLHQPFVEAISPEPPPDALPPVRTLAGKSVGKLAAEVHRLWPTIRFRDASGRPLTHLVTLQTHKGKIVIELFPEIAPNHCRSFLALCLAGYYDGLQIETRIGDPADAASPRAVAGGSPEGDGNERASLGYWLRPEILTDAEAARRKVAHVRGIVGAVPGAGLPHAAGCRFYICLTDVPQMNGHYTLFGKVIEGLSILDELHGQPVRETPTPPWQFLTPLVIEKAIVTTR